MAIQVLIVDDEKFERVLIRKGINWEVNGFEIIGEAESSLAALDFIRLHKPDVVITDVNMPYMDGLELTEHIRKEHPLCRVVIVTGYREFEYAQKAVKLGVEDFLLKPISLQEIAQTATKLKERISLEQLRNREVESLRESILADRDIVIESFLQRLVEGRVSQKEAEEKLALYQWDGLLRNCICVNIRRKEIGGAKSPSDWQSAVYDLITKQALQNTVCFIHYLNSVVLFFYDTNSESALSLIGETEKNITNVTKATYAIGISRQHHGFEGIEVTYEEAKKAMSACDFWGQEKYVTYEQYLGVISRNPHNMDIDWEDLLFSVENCLIDRVKDMLEKYVNFISSSGVADVEYIKLMTMQLLSKAASTLHKYGVDLPDIAGANSLYNDIRHVNTVAEMESCLEEYVGAIVGYHDSKRVKKHNKIAQEAIKYLDENLFDPNLSLKTTATSIFTNESYLSRTFKKETGLSLMEYILKKRILESVRLLNTTDLKVYEIAEKVGFRNNHYFSICFKKQMGLTVKEFKSAGKNYDLSSKNIKLINDDPNI